MTRKYSVVTDEDRAAFACLGMEMPPTQDELPESDGMPMDSERQALQMDLLFDPLRLHFAGQDVYVGKNQIIYYSVEQARNRDFLGPDVYVVLNVPDRERLSWVIWEEGKAPDVVLEILSPTTAARDRGEKKRIYQDNIGAREYFWYDPVSGELAGFVLHDGRYLPLDPDAAGRMPCPILDLALVIWEGAYQERSGHWLRWATRDGVVLPTREEAERRRADEERARAQEAHQRAEEAQRQLLEAQALLARYRERFGDVPQ